MITTVEAHIVLMITALANLAGLVVAVLQIRQLRTKLNGHLTAHHAERPRDR